MRKIDPGVDGQRIKMPCPCKISVNRLDFASDEVKLHLFSNGVHGAYPNYNEYREKDDLSTSASKPVNARNEFSDNPNFASEIPTDDPHKKEMVIDNFEDHNHVKFQQLLVDGEKPLYQGYPDFTKLSATVELLSLKGKHGCPNTFFTELLVLLKKMLPKGNELVENTYEAKCF